MHETDAANKQMQQSNRHLSNVYRQRSQHYIGTTHCIHNMAERSYVRRTPFLIMMKMSKEIMRTIIRTIMMTVPKEIMRTIMMTMPKGIMRTIIMAMLDFWWRCWIIMAMLDYEDDCNAYAGFWGRLWCECWRWNLIGAFHLVCSSTGLLKFNFNFNLKFNLKFNLIFELNLNLTFDLKLY